MKTPFTKFYLKIFLNKFYKNKKLLNTSTLKI